MGYLFYMCGGQNCEEVPKVIELMVSEIML